jgi:putative hydrolase of the HAD superfamily
VPTEPWSVHTVVFDLDDTLYLERDYVLSGFAAVDQWLASRRGVKGFGFLGIDLFDRGLRGHIFDEALRQLGVRVLPDLIGEMLAVYRAHTPILTLLPDAVACLNGMRGHLKMALLTDGYQSVQQNKVASLGIADRFDCIIFTDAFGREFWKPSAVGFARIMEQLPGPGEGYVYVADNPRKDFIGPRLLGWRTVRIRRNGGEHATYEPAKHEAADREITTLANLSDLWRQ